MHANQPEPMLAARRQLDQPISHAQLPAQQAEGLVGHGNALLEERFQRHAYRLGKRTDGAEADVEQVTPLRRLG